MPRRRSTLLAVTIVIVLAFFASTRLFRNLRHTVPAPSVFRERNTMPSTSQGFVLASTAFPNGTPIPSRYTCDSDDVSPALAWSGVPPETQSLALIADDPDAPMGTWTHWLIWNIPAGATLLPEDVPKIELLDNGARQGLNDFHRIGYGGPCPPAGKPHRYFFKLYALSARLDLKPGATKAALESAIQPHLLAQTQTMGTFQRR